MVVEKIQYYNAYKDLKQFLTHGKCSLSDSFYYHYFIIHRSGCAALMILNQYTVFPQASSVPFFMFILYKSISKAYLSVKTFYCKHI